MRIALCVVFLMFASASSAQDATALDLFNRARAGNASATEKLHARLSRADIKARPQIGRQRHLRQRVTVIERAAVGPGVEPEVLGAQPFASRQFENKIMGNRKELDDEGNALLAYFGTRAQEITALYERFRLRLESGHKWNAPSTPTARTARSS